jgi:hypothetical protein
MTTHSDISLRHQGARFLVTALLIAGMTAGTAALVLTGSLAASDCLGQGPAVVTQNVTARTPGYAPIFQGKIVAVFPDRKELIIRVQQDQDTYQIAAGAKVIKNHRPASLTMLTAGDVVIFRLVHEQSRSVITLEALSSH